MSVRGTWIWDERHGRLVPKAEYHADRHVDRRGAFPTPMVIMDGIETKSMVDGKIYTSKAKLRRSYRERGYVEVGNEEQKMPPRPEPDRDSIRRDIKTAFEKAGIN